MPTTIERPRLREIPLADVWPPLPSVGRVYCTMSEGQAWDGLFAAAYDTGCVLLELDADEVIRRAYVRA